MLRAFEVCVVLTVLAEDATEANHLADQICPLSMVEEDGDEAGICDFLISGSAVEVDGA